ncbi:MAG TPA: GTP-binding protein [Gammaproteobacteria bacterium]|jgi:G3E family GTPase|nr:GTP-binding protein [Gammaproteobacteria bacterium]
MTMPIQTPITLVSGPLGSGKTTLLRHILTSSPLRLALIINEFGELGIDGKLIQGKNVRLTELDGGCVCCSLIGEFEAAVEEIIETAAPEAIVVETTGVAEPEALVFDVSEMLPRVWIDGVVTVMDADALIRFPDLGRTTRMQVAAADLLLLNKVDLVAEEELEPLQAKLRELNPQAPIVPTRHGRVDSALLFGLTHSRKVEPVHSIHQPEYESFVYRPARPLKRDCFEQFALGLDPDVYRAKGFVHFPDGTYLFNYVNGRWDLEPLTEQESGLVFIGRGIKAKEVQILKLLQACEV